LNGAIGQGNGQPSSWDELLLVRRPAAPNKTEEGRESSQNLGGKKGEGSEEKILTKKKALLGDLIVYGR